MQQRSRHGRTTQSRYAADIAGQRAPRSKQRAFCIAALEEGDDLSELRELLRTAGVDVVGQAVQHREQPHPNSYLGPGKIEEVRALALAADANVVACDDELSPRQERNLEHELGLPVVDRTTVILDIFASHAHSAEGKLQVELAQLEYNMARMRGLWTHLDRLGVGGVGTRGPGETQIETDRRLARNRISALKRRLVEVKGSREVMRAERERAGLPQIALAGYTNAGKSTLLNALTGAQNVGRAGPPVPHARSDDPRHAARRAARSCSPTPSASSASCRTSSSRRSARRSRRRGWPTSCCTSWTPRSRRTRCSR